MTTNIYYNNVPLLNVLTEDVDMQVEKDRTGVDPLMIRIRATFSTVVATGVAGPSLQTGGAVGSASLADGLQRMAVLLNQPRREFKMTITNAAGGEDTFLHVKPVVVRPGVNFAPLPQNSSNPGIGPDIDNGPTPTAKLTELAGGNTARLRFSVLLSMPICDFGGSSPNLAIAGIINLRWWSSETIEGRDWSTVRRLHGRLRVAHNNVNVHEAIRTGFVLPPLQSGFVRENIQIDEAPNGLDLEFVVTDREWRAVPPWPATWWDGEHRVRTPLQGTALYRSDMRIALEGNKSVDKRELLSLAARILDSKLHILEGAGVRGAKPGATFLEHAEFTDKFTGNRVEASATIRHFPATEGQAVAGGNRSQLVALANVMVADFGTPIERIEGFPYDPEVAYLPGQTATSDGLFRALLQDPCHPATMPQGSRSRAESPKRPARSTTRGSVLRYRRLSRPLPPWQPEYTTEHLAFPYTDYQVDSDVQSDSGKHSFPVGESSDDEENQSENESKGASTIAAGSELVAMHRGSYKRVIQLVGERLEAWPVMLSQADFTSAGVVHTWMAGNIANVAPILSADGRHQLFRMDGYYEFELDRRPTLMPVGKVPWNARGQQLVAVPSNVFRAAGTTGSPV